MNRSIHRTDRNLSSALNTGEIDFIVDAQAKRGLLKEEHRELLREHPLSTLTIRPEGLQACVLKVLIDRKNPPINIHERPSLTRGIIAGLRAYSISRRVWNIEESPELNPGSTLDAATLLTPEIHHWYDWKYWFSCAVIEVCGKTLGKQEVRNRRFSVDFYGELAVFKMENEKWLGTYAIFLSLKTLVFSHFDALLYSRISDVFNKYPATSLYAETLEMLECGDHDLINYENEAHDIFKEMPTLAISSILRRFEKVCDISYAEQMDLLKEKYPNSKVVRKLSNEPTTIEKARVRLELIGLWKCFGAVIIDLDKSAKNLLTLLGNPREVDPQEPRKVRNVFVHLFCKEYYKKHQVWPNVSFGEKAPLELREAVRKGRWAERGTREWRSSDFEEVFLMKTLEFDYFIEASDLLSDKAIIPDKSSWILEYDRIAYFNKYGSWPTRVERKTNRVLIKYLTETPVPVKEVIEMVEENRVPDDDKVMVAVWKEWEHKREKARGFVKLTASMRFYQTATENNIGKRIFPYVKYQSMTMSEKELVQQLNRLASAFSPNEDHDHAFITLDFKNWCLLITHDCASPLLTEVDRLFGFKRAYRYSHLFPIESLLVVQDRYHPPREGADGPGDTDRSSQGVLHWLEGMRQKGWTLLTTCMILSVAEKFRTEASILGQGDNQVIVLKIPEQKLLLEMKITKRDFIQSFIDELELSSRRLGMELKRQETWSSTVLFEYSKKYFFLGGDVSGSLKKACRISTESSDSLVTLSSDIASIFSGGVSVASVDNDPGPAYILSCIEACSLLDRNFRGLSLLDLCTLILTPRHMGGFPIVNFSQFCYRGTADPVTAGVEFLLKVNQIDPSVYSSMSRFIDFSPGIPDFQLLYQDPLSLNIEVPVQAENRIRALLRENLCKVVKNPILSPLFGIQADFESQKLVEDLSHMNPMNPKLCNYIYKLSNVALRERTIGRFASSRSVRRVLASEAEITESDLRALLRRSDRECIRRYQEKLASPCKSLQELFLQPPSLCCSFVIAHFLREKTWGIKMVGVTMPSPSEQTRLVRWSNVRAPEKAILIHCEGGTDLHTKKGPFEPYIGSKTTMRIKKSNLEIVDTDSMIRSLEKTIQVAPWACGVEDQNLRELFKRIFEEKTTINWDALINACGRIIGGSLTHRLKSEASPEGAMINGISCIGTHIRVITDTAEMFGKSLINWTIFFQAVILCQLSRLSQHHVLGGDISGSWAAEFGCDFCTQKVPDDNYTLSRPPNYAGIPLGELITEVRVSTRESLNPGSNLSGREQLSILLAKKWSSFLVGWDSRSMAVIQEKQEGTVQIPGFVNITETSLLDAQTFMDSLSLELLIKSSGSYHSLRRKLLWLYSTPGLLGPLRTLSDTLISAGLLPSLSRIMNIPRTFSDCSHALQGSIYSYLLKQTSFENRQALTLLNYVTPDTSEWGINRRREVLISLSIQRGLVPQEDCLRPGVLDFEARIVERARQEGRPEPPLRASPFGALVDSKTTSRPLLKGTPLRKCSVWQAGRILGTEDDYLVAAAEVLGRFKDLFENTEGKVLFLKECSIEMVSLVLHYVSLTGVTFGVEKQSTRREIHGEPFLLKSDRCGLSISTAMSIYVKSCGIDKIGHLYHEIPLMVGTHAEENLMRLLGFPNFFLSWGADPHQVSSGIVDYQRSHLTRGYCVLSVGRNELGLAVINEIKGYPPEEIHQLSSLESVKEQISLSERFFGSFCLNTISLVLSRLEIEGTSPAEVASGLRTRLLKYKALIAELTWEALCVSLSQGGLLTGRTRTKKISSLMIEVCETLLGAAAYSGTLDRIEGCFLHLHVEGVNDKAWFSVCWREDCDREPCFQLRITQEGRECSCSVMEVIGSSHGRRVVAGDFDVFGNRIAPRGKGRKRRAVPH